VAYVVVDSLREARYKNRKGQAHLKLHPTSLSLHHTFTSPHHIKCDTNVHSATLFPFLSQRVEAGSSLCDDQSYPHALAAQAQLHSLVLCNFALRSGSMVSSYPVRPGWPERPNAVLGRLSEYESLCVDPDTLRCCVPGTELEIDIEMYLLCCGSV
jgi:hypothetical protein